ncbi:unnamed protein product [Nippostrongylus brasiliensis]|uniref:peptidylprolyl isomerase n=1 Tax=Nippostrongylus brasiliensis TaxID=27835 RepID=A0A158QXL1_NIPBR|nr:unnamed protein product [Nippostrongylus brasiliensis]
MSYLTLTQLKWKLYSFALMDVNVVKYEAYKDIIVSDTSCIKRSKANDGASRCDCEACNFGDGTKNNGSVTCHSVLTLQHGKKVDSSRDRGSPFKFKIGEGEVIKRWDQGVAQTFVGQRAKLTTSHDLGYGSGGVPGAIPSNSTLIIDVELISVN